MPLTCKQAAIVLECTPAMVSHLCRTKRIPATKDSSGAWIIQIDDLSHWLLMKAHGVKAVAKYHGIHPETVRRWLRAGKVAGLKDGQWLVQNPIFKPARIKKKPKK